MTNLSFLKDLTNKLSNYVSKHNSFSDLYNALINDKFKLYAPFDYSNLLDELNIIKDVINKIISIIYKPHIKSIKEETIIRSELSNNLSVTSFLDTLKDTKLWKVKDNKLIPEYVCNEVNIDTLDTYENRFISSLIDELEVKLKVILINITPIYQTIEETYERSGLNYGSYSFINDLVNNLNNDLFIHERSKKSKIYNLTKSLIKKIKHLKGSELYKESNNKLKLINIIPTNILIHDPLYNYCYRYYKENYLNKYINNNELDIYYYNYVLVSFIKYIGLLNVGKTSINKKEIIYFDKSNRLIFNKLSFKKSIFSFILTMDKDNLAFNIETRLINKAYRTDTKVDESNKSNSYILTSFLFNKDNEDNLLSLLNKNKLNNEVLFTMNNLIGNYQNVINLNYYKKDNDVKLKNFLNSLMLIFNDCDLVLIRGRCPVCGSSDLTYDGFNYKCNNCLSTYSINNTVKGNVMWLKNLRRNAYGE